MPAEAPLTIRKHVVWLCAGCDDCEPLDGSEPSRYPCRNSDSANGADVFECGPVLDLIERAMPRLDLERDGGSDLYREAVALLRTNGRLA